MNLRKQFLVATVTLLDQLPAVRDGDVDAIRDARVATRRLRAMLSILSVCHPRVDLRRAARTLKRAGRALGRVRELDAALEVVGELERRSPAAAGCAGDIRRSIVAEQVRARRSLVKELDELPLDGLEHVVERIPRARRHGTMPGSRPCDGPIRDALRDQAMALRQAIERGSVLYVPKRAHGVRIDAKKLRYVLEFTGDPEAIAPNGLEVLKKIQDVLGRLRDRQVVRERFARLWDDGDGSGVTAVLATIDADCRRLFAAYVSRRARLLDVCADIERSTTPASARSSRTTVAPKLAVAGLPSLPS